MLTVPKRYINLYFWRNLKMTKRIFALVIAVLMTVACFASCNTTTDATKTPAKTQTPGTVAPTTSGDTTPEDTAPTSQPTAPVDTADTAAPTTEGGDDPEDPFEFVGGIEKMFTSGSIYGKGFEIWPYEGNNQWCPLAFYQGTFILSKEEVDATEGLGTPDYQYKFVFYYQDMTEGQEGFSTPYTTICETAYVYGGDSPNVIYRPLVGSCEEGNLCSNFIADHEYMLIMQVKKGEENLGFAVYTVSWSQELAEAVVVYDHFWSEHNREDGYTAGSQTLTAADIEFARQHGYDEKGQWVGIA